MKEVPGFDFTFHLDILLLAVVIFIDFPGFSRYTIVSSANNKHVSFVPTALPMSLSSITAQARLPRISLNFVDLFKESTFGFVYFTDSLILTNFMEHIPMQNFSERLFLQYLLRM